MDMKSLFLPFFSRKIWNKSGKFPLFEASCLYLAIGTHLLQKECHKLVLCKIPRKYRDCAGAVLPNRIAARHDLTLEKLTRL